MLSRFSCVKLFVTYGGGCQDRILCPWDSPGKNTGVGCSAFLQGIFLTQELNPLLQHLLHWRQALYPLSHLGSRIYVTVYTKTLFILKRSEQKNSALGHCKLLFPDRNIKKKKSCQNKFCWSCRKQSVAPIHQANIHSRKGHFQNGRKLLFHFYSSLHSLPSTVVIRWKSGAQIHTIEPKAADQSLLANYCVHPFKLFWRISERMT